VGYSRAAGDVSVEEIATMRSAMLCLALFVVFLAGCGPGAQHRTLSVTQAAAPAISKMVLALQDLDATIKNVDEGSGIVTTEWKKTSVLGSSEAPCQISIVVLDAGDSTRLKLSVTQPGESSISPTSELFADDLIRKYEEYVGPVQVEDLKTK
jgi:hypothetical protein